MARSKRLQLSTRISPYAYGLLYDLVARFQAAHPGTRVGVREVIETAILFLNEQDPAAIRPVEVDRDPRGARPTDRLT